MLIIWPQPKEKLLKEEWHGRTFKTKSMFKHLFSKLFKADVRHNIKMWFKFLMHSKGNCA